MPAPSRHGFSLIELALVVVIIGLVVGGVLVGRDLIKASEIRAGISQIEKYNVAVNTFKLKYDCLPGDCPDPCFLQQNAACQTSYSAQINSQDTLLGTGKLSFYNGYFGNTAIQSKIVKLFLQLQLAGLTDGLYLKVPASTRFVGKDAYFPPFLAGNASGIFPFSFDGLRSSYLPLPSSPYNGGNKWYVGVNPTATDTSGWGLGGATANSLSPALTPAEAYAIDSKMDNGNPTSGKVQAFWGVTSPVHSINGGDFHYG